jgi:hypothetical protein
MEGLAVEPRPTLYLRISVYPNPGAYIATPFQSLGFESLHLYKPSTTMSDNYGSYQTEIYGKGALMGILPGVTTDPRQLEERARESLGIRSFNYVAGGAGEKATMDSNRLAFRQWKM